MTNGERSGFMFQSVPRRLALLAFFTFIPTSIVFAAQPGMVSTMRNVKAVTESRGYCITPIREAAGQAIPGDEAPAQRFEIIRPSGSRVTIGRLFTSCTCVQLEASQATFEQDERIVLTLRNVLPTPPEGQTYALYVQLTGPIRTTLRYDTFVRSDRFVSQPIVVEAAETAEPAGEDVPASEATPEAVAMVSEKTVSAVVDEKEGGEADAVSIEAMPVGATTGTEVLENR